MYEEGGDRQEGGTCSGRKMGELGRAGLVGRQEWGVRLGGR